MGLTWVGGETWGHGVGDGLVEACDTGRWGEGRRVGMERCGTDGWRMGDGCAGARGASAGWRGGSAHLWEKQWAADTTQQVCTRLPAQKLFPM